MAETTYTERELFMLTEALRVKIKADRTAERTGEINGIFIGEYAKLRGKVLTLHAACFAD